jgi:hypothetical protein
MRLIMKVPAYRSWLEMRRRVLKPASKNYNSYGGRRITIDPAWNSFSAFLADMGHRPEGRTLDRIDNDGPF